MGKPWNEHIKAELKRRRWNQHDLARESGVAVAVINRFIRGERHVREDTLCRICAPILEVTVTSTANSVVVGTVGTRMK